MAGVFIAAKEGYSVVIDGDGKATACVTTRRGSVCAIVAPDRMAVLRDGNVVLWAELSGEEEAEGYVSLLRSAESVGQVVTFIETIIDHIGALYASGVEGFFSAEAANRLKEDLEGALAVDNNIRLLANAIMNRFGRGAP